MASGRQVYHSNLTNRCHDVDGEFVPEGHEREALLALPHARISASKGSPKGPQTPWTFSDAARRASCVLGTPAAFALACATI
jgi:hypothetical protein